MRLLTVSVAFLLLACTPVQATAQQPKPQLAFTVLHDDNRSRDGFSVTYFEHEGIRCYVTREYVFSTHASGVGGGISCVRK
jgi:hypothetical protein